MKTEDIRKMAQAWQSVQEASKENDNKEAPTKIKLRGFGPDHKKSNMSNPVARGALMNKEAMDPVDHKELKGTHAQRKDKDIDNDGKVDKSDEYLHNRRKAISKAMKKESNDDTRMGTITVNSDEERKKRAQAYRDKKGKAEVTMNTGTIGDKKGASMEQKEETVNELKKSTLASYIGKAHKSHEKLRAKQGAAYDKAAMTGRDDDEDKGHELGRKADNRTKGIMKAAGKLAKEETDWTVYNRILENRAMHYKGAAPADPMDKGQSPGGKKMKKDIDIDTSGKISNYDDLGHDDASKAGRITKKAPGRTNDRSEGDKNIVNPVKDTTK